MFLHFILTYFQLVPEAFMADGHISQEKLVQFAMSFISKDAAAWWAEQCSSTIPFPFPTWTEFEAKFCLWFVEENEQNQALVKLESPSYFQGSHNVYRYTDNFEELAAMASYTDTLVWVTKYCSSLNLQINVAITMSRTAPGLTDYAEWCEHAFRQYEAFTRIQTRNTLAQSLAALPWAHVTGVFPAPAPAHLPAPFMQAVAPALLVVVPMDVDQLRSCKFQYLCFQRLFRWMSTDPDTHIPMHPPLLRSCRIPCL
jgi:hypothetical protein